jgi:hypothetical protein
MMVAEVSKKKVPLPTDTGGIVEVSVLGVNGQRYTWMGTGSVSRTLTQQQEQGSKTMRDVEYIEVLIVPDPTKHNAVLPVIPAPAKGDKDAH